MVKWKDVKNPFNQGGLGIRSLAEMNKALQAKWLWKFLKEDGCLWRRIVQLQWGNFESCNAGRRDRKPHGLGLWKNILSQRPRFRDYIRWDLGKGDMIKFWYDEWIEGESLNSRFSRIFAIAQSRNMVIEEAYR